MVAEGRLGLDESHIEDTWQYLDRGAYWGRGPIIMAAIAAVDVARWDIKAKTASMPWYQLLGSASRTGALAYGHASGSAIESLFVSIRNHLTQGFKAIRVQTGVPGLGQIFGVATNQQPGQRYDYEPAKRLPLPAEETWDTRAYLRHVPTVFAAVREEFGPELILLHDGHHRMAPNQAAQLYLGMAIHNFGIQEFMKHSDETLQVFRTSYTYQDGLPAVLTAGIGVSTPGRVAVIVRDVTPLGHKLALRATNSGDPLHKCGQVHRADSDGVRERAPHVQGVPPQGREGGHPQLHRNSDVRQLLSEHGQNDR